MNSNRISSPQIPFEFSNFQKLDFTTFIQGENKYLLQLLDTLTKKEQNDCLYIWGSEGTGKTHLLQATCKQADEMNSQVTYIPLKQHTHGLSSFVNNLSSSHEDILGIPFEASLSKTTKQVDITTLNEIPSDTGHEHATQQVSNTFLDDVVWSGTPGSVSGDTTNYHLISKGPPDADGKIEMSHLELSDGSGTNHETDESTESTETSEIKFSIMPPHVKLVYIMKMSTPP